MPRTPHSRRRRALAATGRIVAVHHAVLHLEFLLADRDRRPGGLNDPAVSRAADLVRTPAARALVRRAAYSGPARVLDGAALLAAAALVTGRGGALAPGVLALTRALAAPSTAYGSDGSDTVGLATATVLTVARSTRDPRTLDACLWFLALYAAHGYLVSGLAKVAGQRWRDGSAVRAVLATRSYGRENWYRAARERPGLARVATNAVVLGECAFPLALLLRWRPGVEIVLHTVTAFHLGVARTMGLNRFVPAFLALQPAVRYVTGPRAGAPGEQPRDDLLPRVVAALAPLALGALAAAAALDRRRVSRPRPGDEQLTLPGGDRLRLRRVGRGAPRRPVVVLVHGIGSTAEQWEVLARALRDTHEVLAYDRAGYGASPAPRTPAPDLLAAEVDRLRAVVDTATGGRPLVLVGHSTGAHLVWALTPELGERLLGTVLVEGVHPHEVAAFGLAGPGGRAAVRAASVRTFWVRYGLAPLLDAPPWLGEVPSDIRALVGAQQRRPALHRAAHEEWAAVTAADLPVAVEGVHGAVVVVSAERSARLLRPGDDPLGPAAGLRGARHEVLPDCGGADVLWRAAPVARLARIVSELGAAS